jgi:hypothetical protein
VLAVIQRGDGRSSARLRFHFNDPDTGATAGIVVPVNGCLSHHPVGLEQPPKRAAVDGIRQISNLDESCHVTRTLPAGQLSGLPRASEKGSSYLTKGSPPGRGSFRRPVCPAAERLRVLCSHDQ